MAEAVEHENEQRFARVFFTRGTPATWALIGANVAIFALMAYVARSVSPDDPGYTSALFAFGAKVNSLIDRGEYWRFVNPIFIHIGPIHLLVNMYSLYVIGPQVERLYGTARFLILYLLTGVAGVAASYYFAPGPGGVSAGASGALFGLLGVLLVFGVRYRNELPGVFRRAFSPRGLVPVLVLNLFITFAIPFIDKWAHLGGLFAGILLAAAIPYFRANERRAGFVWRALAALCVAGTLACFGMAFKAYRGVPIVRTADVNRFIDVYNSAERALDSSMHAVSSAHDGEAIPPDAADQARTAANQLRSGPGLDDRSRALLARDADLLDRAAGLVADPHRRPTDRDVAALADDRDQLGRDWDSWLASEGTKFNLSKKNNDNNASGGDDDN
jgi:membrane associated rhomboid family serine protease